jgi:hypothetical protein
VTRGGGRIPIQWEAVSPKPSPRPVSIYLSVDNGNSWSVVEQDLENTGNYTWQVPTTNSSRCKLKITMRDSGGVVGEAVSATTFSIDSTRPTSAIGVKPTKLESPVGDLSTVLAPLGGAADSAVPVETVAEPEVASSAPAESEPPVPAAREPLPEVSPDEVVYTPEPTPSPEENWSRPREETYDVPPGPGAPLDDLLKAAFGAEKAGRTTIAKDYYLRAAELKTGDPRPHIGLGRIYAKSASFSHTGKRQAFEAALYEFEKALDAGGEDADVLNDMGWIFLETKRLDDAEKALRRATEIGQKAIYWCNLGITLKRKGDKTGAIAAFERALSADEKTREASFYLGMLYGETGDWKSARAHWRDAVDGYGVDSRLGKIALSGLQEAREALGEVQPLDDGPTIREKLDRVR